MSKEFRVWCKTRNEYEVDEVLIDNQGRLVQHGRNMLFMYLKPENHIVEWFTGILDKNGDKIFEGDKCRIWMDGAKQDKLYIVRNDQVLYFETRRNKRQRITNIEVVGNAHEKKEGK